MSEKKQVVYDLRVSYNGPFVVDEFYEEIDKWIEELGLHREPKKNVEHLTKSGKKLEYYSEISSHLDDLHHGQIVFRAYMNDVKEVTVKSGNKKIHMQNGDVLVNIDGFVDAHNYGTFWQQKPVLYFLRAIVDRFIWPIWGEKFDGVVIGQCHELNKRVRAYFNVQRMKYG